MMRAKLTVRKKDGNYIIVLPSFIIKNTDLTEFSTLTVHINGKNLVITNISIEESKLLEKLQYNKEYLSKILEKEESILSRFK